MATLSTKQRNDLPDSAFCGPHRSYPITDAEDVEKAAHLIGKAASPDSVRQCIIGKAKAHGWAIPDAWKEDSKMAMPTALGRRVGFADGVVRRRGPIFKAGDYPDKGISVSPEELYAMLWGARDVPVNLGHPGAASPLDGKLGTVRPVEIVLEDGEYVLVGEASLPEWLDAALPQDSVPASVELDPGAKTLEGLALVESPRVNGVALSAAFATFASRHNTPQGRMQMQRLHNIAAQGGATCKAANAKMASSHENSANQQIHDIAADHGATCASLPEGQNVPGPIYYSSEERKERVMNFKDRVKAWFNAGMPEVDDIDAAGNATSAAGANVTAGVATAQFTAAPGAAWAPAPAPDPEVVRLRAEVDRLVSERRASDARAFAEEQIQANKALPAEREVIVAQFTLAAQDDATGLVTFADGSQHSRIEGLRALFAARPSHLLTQERVRELASRAQNTETVAVFANPTQTPDPSAPKDTTPDAVARYLGMTGAGRDVLAHKQNGNGNGNGNGH